MPSTPKILFKYVGSKEHHFEILQNLEIRFSQPSASNDPLDCIPAVVAPADMVKFIDAIAARNSRRLLGLSASQIRDAKNAMVAEYQAAPDALVERYSTALKDKINGLGILSLASKRNNMALWAHYSENHEGFVIEFNSNCDPFFKRSRDRSGEGEVSKVIYSQSRVEVSCDNIKLPPNLLFKKRNDWEYEKEWRVIRRLANCDSHTADQTVHLCRINPAAILRINIGHAASTETVQEILKVTSAGTRLAHVTVFQCQIDSSQEGLSFGQLQ